MQFRGFELQAVREPESGSPYCDVFHGGERVVRVFRRGDAAENVILFADATTRFRGADLAIVMKCAEYCIPRDIPAAYLEEFAVRERCNADYFLGLYNTTIAASALYILCTNKHVFNPVSEIGEEPLDMEYLFDRLFQLLDIDALRNLPKGVLADLVEAIDRAGFPLIPEHRAVLERVRARHKLFALFPCMDDGNDSGSA